ncbi:hypothetical protein C8R45DRAFT_937614 [Mycena sanguinolenta]|nr:hypothetical protein C8R45DRAFT_937614 [Mycena sanguinolenta]
MSLPDVEMLLPVLTVRRRAIKWGTEIQICVPPSVPKARASSCPLILIQEVPPGDSICRISCEGFNCIEIPGDPHRQLAQQSTTTAPRNASSAQHLKLLKASADAQARIPEILAQFDTSGWRSIRRYIFQAHTCMRSILVLFSSEAIPLGASVDLWEAVWPWIAFLDEYEQSLSSGKDSIGEESPNAYKRYLALIRYLEKDETARRLIYSTAGLYVVVGRAWPYLIQADAETLYSVSHFLAQWFGPDQWNPAAYEDLIVGCGGSRMDLATLVVSQIRRMLPRPDTTFTEKTVLHLIGVLCIVYGANISEGHEPDPALDDALLSCGIVTVLTTASRALCRCHLDVAETVVKGFL